MSETPKDINRVSPSLVDLLDKSSGVMTSPCIIILPYAETFVTLIYISGICEARLPEFLPLNGTTLLLSHSQEFVECASWNTLVTRAFNLQMPSQTFAHCSDPGSHPLSVNDSIELYMMVIISIGKVY